MSIRDDAVAAWNAKVDEWVQASAEHLTAEPDGVLWDAGKNSPVVATKDLVTAHRNYSDRLVVFTGPDDTDDTHLAVRGDAESGRTVTLVEQADGAWTRKSDPLEGLAHLGQVLAGDA